MFFMTDNSKLFLFAISFNENPSKISCEIWFSMSIKKLLTSMFAIVSIMSSLTSNLSKSSLHVVPVNTTLFILKPS